MHNPFKYSKSVEDKITYYPSSKAPGNDGIHIKFLKVLSHESTKLSTILADFYSILYLTSTTPSKWNEAITAIIPKHGKPPTIDNTRPIALTQMLRRLFESVLHSKWNKEDWFTPHAWQAGGRKGYSTLTHVAVGDHLAKNGQQVTTLLDIKKAFDSIRHSDLEKILKGRNMNMADLKLILALFTTNNRTKLIINGNIVQQDILFQRGIFQGSVLSPGLFSLCIDPLLKEIQLISGKEITCLAFADDLKIQTQTFQKNQEILDLCGKWSNEYHVTFNVQKCYQLQQANSNDQILTLYDIPLQTSESEKYLGIEIKKSGVDWKGYIKRITLKATKMLSFLKSVGYYWPVHTRLHLYKTFVRSQLEYASPLLSVWLQKDNDITKDCIKTLELVQTEAIKFIMGMATSNPTTTIKDISTVYMMMDLMPILSRINYMRNSFHFHVTNLHPDNPWNEISIEVQARFGNVPSFNLVHNLINPANSIREFLSIEKDPAINPKKAFKDHYKRAFRSSIQQRQGIMVKLVNHHTLSTIKTFQRLARVVNQDTALKLPSLKLARLAMNWRRNQQWIPRSYTCNRCALPFNRGHITRCNLDEWLLNDLEQELHLKAKGIVKDYKNAVSQFNTKYPDTQGHYTIVDYILNIGDIRTITATLNWLDSHIIETNQPATAI